MRIVHISDTHMRHNSVKIDTGDVLIHSGDATESNRILEYQDEQAYLESLEEFKTFLRWFSSFDHRVKIYVPGNNDVAFLNFEEEIRNLAKDCGVSILINEGLIIDEVKFFGVPQTKTFMAHHAYQDFDDEKGLGVIFKKIPKDTEILISHSPPLKILDLSFDKNDTGSNELLKAIQKLPKLRLHLFGHCHEQGGKNTRIDHIEFYNSAVQNKSQVIDFIKK